MIALAASRTASLFISEDPRRRLAVQFSRRCQDVAAITPPALAPLPLLRNSLRIPNGRKGRGRARKGDVWAEEKLGGSHDLEAEIYEFMERSASPMDFPSKEVLIAAGREDLARAIAKEGGWLAYGWDSDEEEKEGIVVTVSDGAGERVESSIFQHRTSVAGEADTFLKADSDSLCASSEGSSRSSTSGRPMDTEVSQDSGIEGILRRLEKERSLAFGFVSPKEKDVMVDEKDSLSMIAGGHGIGDVVGNIESTGRSASLSLGEDSHLHSREQNSHHGSLMDANNDSEPGTWRTWSIQRSGDSLTNFEAAEIVLEEDQRKSNLNFVNRHLIEREKKKLSEVVVATGTNSGRNSPYDNDQGSLNNEISVYLQHLESQLTSALQLFKFRRNSIYSYKDQDQESLLKELHKLSDALEFQQTEIMNATDILRSTRAKLAVMEGKIALEVIESQKVIEEKQIRLDAAARSLCILRHVCIVWSNSASEVLLAGSFDGWTSQRRMEKNNPGVFSLCLKLYPGRYEIKFIVDGVWTVDPLRPITYNNCFQNNLLIVT